MAGIDKLCVSMYKRDFGILALTVFAVYFALQNEGTFTFKKAWYTRSHRYRIFKTHICRYYPIAEDEVSLISTPEMLPKPVIVKILNLQGWELN